MTFDIGIKRDISMRTRDGVELISDVYLPAGEGPFPTLLYRVRGSKSSSFIAGTILMNPILAAERGYAVCIQEVRGRGSSGGEWHPFIHEADDGWDTMEWLRNQPWCNGRIGSYGTAYTGIAALQLAATGHPALEAVVAVVSGVSPHDGWIYTNGAFELGWNNFWAHLTAGSSLKRLDISEAERQPLEAALQEAMANPTEPMAVTPLRNQPQLEEASPHYWTWLEHNSYDDYWAALDVIAKADRLTARVLGVTGWWDNFLGSHLSLYRALRDRSPSGADQRLVIGPWDHFTYVNVLPTTAGAKNFGPAGIAGASPVSEPAAFAWFDRWLRDVPEAEESKAGVKWFASGSYEWRTAPQWPPASETMSLYLDTDARLEALPPGEPGAVSYEYDPVDPTPTIGGRTLMPSVAAAGVQDQSPNAARSDVLAFSSEVLDTSTEIAGELKLELWFSSSVADTDLSAVLVDVDPEGHHWLVADGFVRIRHRNGLGTDEPLVPGEATLIEIDLWASAWTFESGHQIGLHIASASFPRFNQNLNTGQPAGEGTLEDAVVATQTAHCGGATASRLVLPVI
ncbi:MAG: CocE/NonD family hydrolase [bacterium]|nr:CocE/NonD family hydrolase [bacterium]